MILEWTMHITTEQQENNVTLKKKREQLYHIAITYMYLIVSMGIAKPIPADAPVGE